MKKVVICQQKSGNVEAYGYTCYYCFYSITGNINVG